MTSRQNYTTPEWQTLQTAIIGTIRYVMLAETGLFNDLKDKIIANETMHNFVKEANSELLKELIDFDGFKWPIPSYGIEDSDAIEPTVLTSISKSVEILNNHDPENALLFKNLILALAHHTANNDSINEVENEQYSKVAMALETKPQKAKKVWDPNNPLG